MKVAGSFGVSPVKERGDPAAHYNGLGEEIGCT